MESRVIFRDDQEVQAQDLNNIELYAEKSIDDLVLDAIEPGRKFVGFQVSQTSSTEVNVGAGRVYFNGQIFFRADEGGVALNLFGVRPITNKKKIALIASPQTIDTDVQARDFLVNAETLETEPQAVAMTTLRQCNITFVQGDESGSPTVPAVDNNSVLFAVVTMGPAGILSIDYVETNRIRDLALAHARLDENDAYRLKFGSRLDTIGSDVSALQNAIGGLAKQFFVNQIAFDVAQLKDKAGIPTNAASYDSDNFLDTGKSDLTNAAYYARVEEGIRFPAIATQIAQLSLNNQYDTTVSVSNNFLLPKFSTTKRISVVGNDRQVPLSNYLYNTVQLVQKTLTQQVTRWGPQYDVCTNSAFWQSGRYDPITQIFTLPNGNTYKAALDLSGLPAVYTKDNFFHAPIRLQQFWTDTVTSTYWDNVTVTLGASGQIVGQSVLNTQDGYLSSVNLFFSTKAAAGDVRVCICECLKNGSPNYNAVLATTVLLAADIQLYPAATTVPFALPFLKKGSRYALVLITVGNHSICQVAGNKYSQGTFFVSTDGVFSQGDLAYDMAFEMSFASFDQPRVEVAMQPLTLAGGIANVSINATQVIPDGCSILHEVLINGKWMTMGTANALLGLPALLQYRVVLLGTTDAMPGIGLGSQSLLTTWRAANNFKHISIARTLPSGVTSSSIQVKVRLENWDPLHHTGVAKLLTGAGYGTLNTAASVTEVTPIEDATARERVYTFSLGTAVSTYKIQIEGTTDTVLSTFHVAGRKDVAI